MRLVFLCEGEFTFIRDPGLQDTSNGDNWFVENVCLESIEKLEEAQIPDVSQSCGIQQYLVSESYPAVQISESYSVAHLGQCIYADSLLQQCAIKRIERLQSLV